jgi:glycosyltransferase involved in cell wall biosynthesis
MPNVVLMTYEFPPSGGGGVQRCAKFARYLPEFGWTPLVVTGSPVPGRPYDESLLEGTDGLCVVRLRPLRVSSLAAHALAPAKRGRDLVRRAGAASSAGSASEPGDPGTRTTSSVPLSSRLARLVSMDDASWWAPSAARTAVLLGRAHGARAVVASGPPFSVTAAGARAARELGVPLVVDLRDAWRDGAKWFPHDRARRHAREVEQRVLTAADVVLAVTNVIADEARQFGARDVRLLPNGYDAADIVATWRPQAAMPLRLVFMGRIYGSHSEPWDLLAALGVLRRTRPDLDLRLEFVGAVPDSVAQTAAAHGVGDRVDCLGYLPHAEALERVAAADVAVILIADSPAAKASMTGKLFEYLAMGLPTLVLGPADGEAAKLVTSLSAGWVDDPHDVDGIAARLAALAAAKAGGTLSTRATGAGIARYERRALTGELAGILDEATGVPAASDGRQV